MERIIVGDIVKHFKRELLENPGDMYLYKIIAISNNLDNGERLVIYQALYGDNIILHREYNEFMSTVDHNKYPNIKQEYRFERYTDIDTLIATINNKAITDTDNLLKDLRKHIDLLVNLYNRLEDKILHGERKHK